MGRLALSFSATMAIVFAFASSIFGKFPDWVSTNVLGLESRLHYVLFSELRYDVLALALIVAVSPQLLWLARVVTGNFVRYIFHAGYGIVLPGRRLVGAVLVFSLLAAGLSAGLFVQAVSTYAYAILREYARSDQINIGRLIAQANTLGDSDLSGAANLVKRIVKAYPEYDDIEDLNKYIQNISDAKDNSNQLTQAAERFASANSHLLAIQYYRVAKSVFPQNKTAAERISSYVSKFQAARPTLEEFFTLCKEQANLPVLVKRIEEFGFAVREPQSIRSLRLNLAGESGSRVYLQICARPTHYQSFDEYFDALRAEIFDPKPQS
jgi:hypothetical protein